MENLIQQEIIEAIINAKKKGEDIKKITRDLAREFNLTYYAVGAIVEYSAMYGLERVSSPKAAGKRWKPIDYTKIIKKLEDKIYKLEAEIVRLSLRINKIDKDEFVGREIPRIVTERVLEMSEAVHSQKDQKQIDYEKIKKKDADKIRKLRKVIDDTRDRARLKFTELREVNPK